MAKIIKDPIIAQYSEFVKLNGILKNICGCYTILPTGVIYMKSLNDRFEKVLVLKNPEKLSAYLGISVLPNKTFDFTKVAKKSTLSYRHVEEGVELYDDTNDTIDPLLLSYAFDKNIIDKFSNIDSYSYALPNLSDMEIIDNICQSRIIPVMYNHLDKFKEIRTDIILELNEDLEAIPKDVVRELVSAKPVTYTTASNIKMDLTLELFPALKNAQGLYIHVSKIKDEKNLKKTYIVFIEECDSCMIYTICAIYQFAIN